MDAGFIGFNPDFFDATPRAISAFLKLPGLPKLIPDLTYEIQTYRLPLAAVWMHAASTVTGNFEQKQ